MYCSIVMHGQLLFKKAFIPPPIEVGVFCQNYDKFNVEKPIDFMGHSLSVSDVVEILDGENKGAYFCDSFGFKKIDFDTSAVYA